MLGRLASCFRTWVNSINDDDELVEGEEETGPDPEPLTGEEEDEDEDLSEVDSLGSEEQRLFSDEEDEEDVKESPVSPESYALFPPKALNRKGKDEVFTYYDRIV